MSQSNIQSGSWSVRPATEEDIPTVAQWATQSLVGDYELQYDTERKLREEIKSGHSVLGLFAQDAIFFVNYTIVDTEYTLHRSFNPKIYKDLGLFRYKVWYAILNHFFEFEGATRINVVLDRRDKIQEETLDKFGFKQSAVPHPMPSNIQNIFSPSKGLPEDPGEELTCKREDCLKSGVYQSAPNP